MKKSIVFLGTSAFAVPSLCALAENDAFEIRAVITQPDRPVGRKQVITPPPVKEEALKRQLRVLQPENINTWLHDQTELERPDFLIVVSYGQLLKDHVLAWALEKPINVHASLLPLLRGASPLQHSILLGFTETGVTIQRMVKELDAGPIIMQETVQMDARETYTSLHDRLALLGAETLQKALLSEPEEHPQDVSKVTMCSKIKKEDGIIDWKNHTADEIDRYVRALSPWPGVQTKDGIKILETDLVHRADSIEVLCKNNTRLFINTLQPAGKKPMSGHAFSLGYPSLV